MLRIPCTICGKTITTKNPGQPEHFCKAEDIKAHQAKRKAIAAERQAGQAIRHLIDAERSLEAARSQFCAAMTSLPDEHPVREEIRRRYSMLYRDDEGNQTEGMFFKVLPLIRRLIEAL